MATPEDHIVGLTQLIAAHPGVERIILFGSRARGTQSPRSDIDLVVEATNDIDWLALEESVENYPTLLKIDMVPMHQVTGTFKDRVMRDGKELYVRT